MKQVKLIVIDRGPFIAFGETNKGEKVLIINGDLKKSKELLCCQKEDGIFEIIETFENELTLFRNNDDEGLVSLKKLDKTSDSFFKLEDKWVFPEPRIRHMINYLLNDSKLLSIAKIRLNSKRRTISGAMIFGVNFWVAITKIEESGYLKGRLSCDLTNEVIGQGIVAEMLIYSYINKEGLPCFELWQGLKDSQEVFYSHGIMTKDKTEFQHFDTALINFDDDSLQKLFIENKKVKGGDYKKLIRLDGKISINDVYQLSKLYFPLENLINEYYSFKSI